MNRHLAGLTLAVACGNPSYAGTSLVEPLVLTPTEAPTPKGSRFGMVEPVRALVTAIHGNRHIVDIRVSDATLDVFVGWDTPADRFEIVAIPWRALASPSSLPLKLPEGQRLERDPRAVNPPPALPAPFRPEDVGTAVLSDLIGVQALPGADHDRVVAIFPDRVLVAAPHQEFVPPPGHRIFAFDVAAGPTGPVLILATRSDQGFRDGELLMPMLTTLVYAIRLS